MGDALARVGAARSIELEYTGSDLSPAALELAAETVDGTFVPGDAIAVTASLPDDASTSCSPRTSCTTSTTPTDSSRRRAAGRRTDGRDARARGPVRAAVRIPRATCPSRAARSLFFKGAAPQPPGGARRAARSCTPSRSTGSRLSSRARRRCKLPPGMLARVRSRRGPSTAIVRLDERLTRLMPWLRSTRCGSSSAGGPRVGFLTRPKPLASASSEYYDRHYPRHAPMPPPSQYTHPLFQLFLRPARPARARGSASVPWPPRARVFEAGCGEGLLGAAFARRRRGTGSGDRYTGSDLSPRAGIELAAETGDGRRSSPAMPPRSRPALPRTARRRHRQEPAPPHRRSRQRCVREARRSCARRDAVRRDRSPRSATRLGVPRLPAHGPAPGAYFFLGRRRNVRAAAARCRARDRPREPRSAGSQCASCSLGIRLRAVPHSRTVRRRSTRSSATRRELERVRCRPGSRRSRAYERCRRTPSAPGASAACSGGAPTRRDHARHPLLERARAPRCGLSRSGWSPLRYGRIDQLHAPSPSASASPPGRRRTFASGTDVSGNGGMSNRPVSTALPAGRSRPRSTSSSGSSASSLRWSNRLAVPQAGPQLHEDVAVGHAARARPGRPSGSGPRRRPTGPSNHHRAAKLNTRS